MKNIQNYSYLLYGICDDQRFKYVKISSVKSLYLMFNKINVYYEKIILMKKLMKKSI